MEALLADRYVDGIVVKKATADRLAQKENTGVMVRVEAVWPNLPARVIVGQASKNLPNQETIQSLTAAAQSAGYPILEQQIFSVQKPKLDQAIQELTIP